MNWRTLFFGRRIDDLSVSDLKLEVKRLRLFMWIWLFVALLVYFGFSSQHEVLVECVNRLSVFQSSTLIDGANFSNFNFTL